jgi:hypothetical protein
MQPPSVIYLLLINSTNLKEIKGCQATEFIPTEVDGVSCSTDAQNTDCCLVAQFLKTMSPSHNSQINVKGPGGCCAYDGVTCNAVSKRVEQIVWDSRNLKGKIPTKIRLLTSLKVL